MKNSVSIMLVLGSIIISSEAQSQEPTCTTVADCAQKSMEAAYQAKLALEMGTPKGAVMAFNLTECPKGWKLFAPAAGRVIVGSGTGPGLTPREVGQQGGEEQHTLTVAEMPAHNHTPAAPFNRMVGEDGNWTLKEADGSNGELNLKYSTPMIDTGGGQAHNLMQPFHVLLLCERN